MIDFDRERVGDSFLSQFFEKTSGVFAKTLEESGRAVAHFYWRVGYRYRALLRKRAHSQDTALESPAQLQMPANGNEE